jgi:hypothetical protein
VKIPSVPVAVPDGYVTEAGEAIVIKVPRSIRSGTIEAINRLNREVATKRETDQDADDALLHDLSELVLDLVVEWNMDDQEGKPLPLLRSLPQAAPGAIAVPGKSQPARNPERDRVIAEVPLEITMRIVDEVTTMDRDKRPS